MPAKGYQFYKVVDFPDWGVNKVFETTHQSTIFDDFDESPHTTITSVGNADHPEFRKYHVLHETYQKVRGRYQGKPINGYIQQVEFHMFFQPISKRLFVDAPRIFCREMVGRLEISDVGFNVFQQEIDLVKLGNDLRNGIRGGWFGDLKVADISTIGLFGPTVGESAEWEKYEIVGKLKAIDIELDWEDLQLLVKIMSNRGVVLFESLTEFQSLERLVKIQKELDTYIVVQEERI